MLFGAVRALKHRIDKRQFDILKRRRPRNQVETLKNKTDAFVPNIRKTWFVYRRNIHANSMGNAASFWPNSIRVTVIFSYSAIRRNLPANYAPILTVAAVYDRRYSTFMGSAASS